MTKSQIIPVQNDQEQQLVGLNMAIDELKILQNKYKNQGFSRPAFTLGLLNMGLTVFVVCEYPEYFWIVFLAKLVILIPTRLYLGCKDNTNYYLLDFCWVSCILVFLTFIFTAVGVFTPEITRQAMRVLFTFSCGPQGWSIILFSNSLVFHSILHTASVFIHLTPVILCYSIRWNLDKLNDAFPSLFPIDETLLSDNLIMDLYIPSLITYTVWFILYSIWLSFHGLDLPSKGQDTVFNWLYTTKRQFSESLDNIAYKIGKQEKKQQTKGKVMIYMCVHFVQANVLMFWAFLCYEYEIVHLLFILLLCICVLWLASGYYLHISINAPRRQIQKLIDKIQNSNIPQKMEDIEENENKESNHTSNKYKDNEQQDIDKKDQQNELQVIPK